jgi:hypothetical protein
VLSKRSKNNVFPEAEPPVIPTMKGFFMGVKVKPFLA